MTKKQAQSFIDELGAKATVKNILMSLNGESFSDSLKILDAVKVYLHEGAFVDADLINGILDDSN